MTKQGDEDARLGFRVSPLLYWAICRKSARPGAWVGGSELCHLHPTRGAAEACGVLRPGAPELVAVRAEADRQRIYRVVYSLSHTAAGRLAGARGD